VSETKGDKKTKKKSEKRKFSKDERRIDVRQGGQ
jgi:hypothetical protein